MSPCRILFEVTQKNEMQIYPILYKPIAIDFKF